MRKLVPSFLSCLLFAIVCLTDTNAHSDPSSEYPSLELRGDGDDSNSSDPDAQSHVNTVINDPEVVAEPLSLRPDDEDTDVGGAGRSNTCPVTSSTADLDPIPNPDVGTPESELSSSVPPLRGGEPAAALPPACPPQRGTRSQKFCAVNIAARVCNNFAPRMLREC